MHLFDPSQPLGALLLGALLTLCGLVLSSLVHRVIASAMRHGGAERDDSITLGFVSRLAVLAIWVILATFYAHLIPALNRLGAALFAGVSLVSIVIGFAAQTTLGNLIAGLSLVIYKPFRRGDRLQVQAPTKDQCEVGVVDGISLGYTILRTDDGRELVIANGTMAQQTLIKLPVGQAGDADSVSPETH